MISIHMAVLLFGLAGLFGKLILLPAVIIALGRVFFASITLAPIIFFRSDLNFSLGSRNKIITIVFLGILLAFHWFTFFHAIQLSSVAIGLLTYATFPVFTSFLEPIFFKEKFELIYVLMAAIAIFGIALIIPSYDLSGLSSMGAFWGVLSGLSFSFITLINRKMVGNSHPLIITFYQDAVAFLVLLPFIFYFDTDLNIKNVLLLILLGTVFTALAHFLYISSLKYINSRTASIIANLEPVYGILFAWLILSEQISIKTFIGGLLILGTSIVISLKVKK